MKRLGSFLLALLLIFTCAIPFAFAQDRYEQVMDTTNDGGKLTARFMYLGSKEVNDKSGDSTILTSPDGKIMVLDGGNPQAAEYVIKALDTMGVSKIDYLVASHPHVDHVGGFAALIDQYEIGQIYTSYLVYEDSSHYKAYISKIQEKGVEHILLAEGDSFSFGEDVQVEVFHPGKEFAYPEKFPEGSTQFINNNSLVLKFTYNQSTFLFSGDLYTTGEKEVAEKYGEALKSDVHKVNHHGDKTSSSKTWRDAVDMKIAVIMHDAIADMQITNKYNRDDSTMYHTFMDGTVKVSTEGNGEYEVLTERERVTDMFDKK